MNVFKFIYTSRGVGNLTKRAFQVFARFGPNANRMGKRFNHFMDHLDAYNCHPTFPITAIPMSRNPKFAHHLLDRGAELAVHAHTHVDLTTLDFEGQSTNMGDAIHLFRQHGVPFTGFRAPYLRWNEETMRVVERFQFRYSSNQAILWDAIDLGVLTPTQRDGWERGRAFYNPTPAADIAVLPTVEKGFIEIPVSLPDDEILFDRMYVREADTLTSVWVSILEQSYERGELYTLQLHPERIDFFHRALSDLLYLATTKDPGVWIATLGEIAEWWVKKAQNTAKFISEEKVIRVKTSICPGTVVIVKQNGIEQKVDPDETVIDALQRPCVGVGTGSDRDSIQQLRDRGYIVEVGDDVEDFSIHLGDINIASYEDLRKMLDRLEVFSGPLVRFGTWPHGNRSAMAVTGDIDALTIWDFLNRLRGS